jgi:hypothetical protein
MRTRFLPWLLGILVCVTGSVVSAQEGGAAPTGGPGAESMEAMMARLESARTPGLEHERLCKLAGEWKLTVKIWMGGPSAAPMQTTGKSVIRPVLDGRFVQEETQYEMVMPTPDGKEHRMMVKSLGLTGYDNFRKVYVSTWAHTDGTGILRMVGSQAPGSNQIVHYGEMDEPMMNVIGRMVRVVQTITGPNRQVVEVYDLHAGESYKVVEMTYER